MPLAEVPGKEWGAERVRTTVKSYIPMTVASDTILQTLDESFKITHHKCDHDGHLISFNFL